MAVSFYSPYIRHCLRFYLSASEPEFKSYVDKENWESCDDVLRQMSLREYKLIVMIYRNKGLLQDSVREVARATGESEGKLMDLIRVTEKRIAKRRGLI